MSEKRALIGAASVVSQWAEKLKGGHPVADLYTDWDWGYGVEDDTWNEDEDGEDEEEMEDDAGLEGKRK